MTFVLSRTSVKKSEGVFAGVHERVIYFSQIKRPRKNVEALSYLVPFFSSRQRVINSWLLHVFENIFQRVLDWATNFE